MLRLKHAGNLIRQAYRMIGDATPLRSDCGNLCGAVCCKGDADTGMLLFPGEATLLDGVPGFQVSRIQYMDGRAWFLSCEGGCNRELRPLACRMFPLAPHVENGQVCALPDPRGLRMCPLADGASLDRVFWKRVERVFRLLAREQGMLDLMGRISAECAELRRLY